MPLADTAVLIRESRNSVESVASQLAEVRSNAVTDLAQLESYAVEITMQAAKLSDALSVARHQLNRTCEKADKRLRDLNLALNHDRCER